MDEDKKKYTFDDWLKDRLPGDPFELYRNGLLHQEVFQQIIKARTEYFHLAVNLRSTIQYNSEIKSLSYAYNPDEYLKSKIEEIEEWIQKKPQIKKLIYGKPPITGPITGDMYQQLKQLEKANIKPAYKLETIDANVPPEIKEHFVAAVSYRFLQKLKSLQKEEREENQINDNQKYLEILESGTSITAGKMAFFRKIEQEGSYRNKEQVFAEADKIHRKLKGKYLFKNFGTFETRESQFLNEYEGAQTELKEILKRFK